MEYTNKELYKISKTVFHETNLHQQLQAAGSNKAKYLERVSKNKSSIDSQSIVMKILLAFYIIIFTFIPVNTFIQINIISQTPSIDYSWNILVGGSSVSLFLLLQPILLIIFSVTFTWGFLSKEPYGWISTLPFSRKDISKISFFTFLRGIDVQLVVLTLVLPVGTMIGINLLPGIGVDLATNFLMLFICIIVNFANTIFNISIVILVGRRMAKVMEDQEENSKLANFLRIGTMLIYLLFSMLASYSIQAVITYLPRLFELNSTVNPHIADIVSGVLSFIPFPFAGGFLLTSVAIGFSNVPTLVIVGSVIGSVLQIGVAILLFRRALRTLQNITKFESKIEDKKEKKPIIIEVKISKPARAYLKRDLKVISRELQTITYMILPIMIPVSTALAYALDLMVGNTGIHAMVLYITAFGIFSTFFLLMGVTSLESGGETVTSSLPISIRDQIKAKIPLLFSTVPIMMIIAIIIQIKKATFIDILIMTSVQLPAILIVALVGLLLKILLFGKFKYKYAIEEVRTNLKAIKLIGILLTMFIIGAGFIASLLVGYWLTLILEGICFLALLLTYNFMFPKKSIVIN
ncbi:MAG: hypothetical protein FK734_20405 [Asgard group archaeon]|nr:hypothetical protein [Asgard group archaeon]